MRRLLLALLLCGTTMAPVQAAHRPTRYRVQATAFYLHGTTAAGTRSHVGTVAADPQFLPLGTTIRVHGAGGWSGVYLVTDTGRKVKGRSIDLRLSSTVEARRFGKRRVWVQVLKWGTGEVSAEEDAAVRPFH